MGQRSEIYVAFEREDGQREVIARFFGWNYGERMISRVAYTARYLQNRIRSMPCGNIDKDDLISIVETNFDIIDRQRSSDLIFYGYKPSETVRLSVYDDGHLNDGRGFLYAARDGSLRYCFTSNHELKPLDCDAYMLFDTEYNRPQYKWINEEFKNSDGMARCRENIRWLCANASLMSQDELDLFISREYAA